MMAVAAGPSHCGVLVRRRLHLQTAYEVDLVLAWGLVPALNGGLNGGCDGHATAPRHGQTPSG